MTWRIALPPPRAGRDREPNRPRDLLIIGNPTYATLHPKLCAGMPHRLWPCALGAICIRCGARI